MKTTTIPAGKLATIAGEVPEKLYQRWKDSFCDELNSLADDKNELQLEAIKEAAEKGHIYEMILLGTLYEQGDRIEQDYNEAVKWYEKAAEKDNLLANFYLGFFKEKIGDYNQAIQWYEKAIEWKMRDIYEIKEYRSSVSLRDHCLREIAIDELSNLFHKREDYNQEYKYSLMRRVNGSELGDEYAMLALGLWYAEPENTELDYEKSVFWFIMSAKRHGSNTALNRLHIMADTGIDEAMYGLGICYHNNFTSIELAPWLVKTDILHAKTWFKRAKEKGNKKAEKFVKIYELQSLAENGDDNAMYELALIYKNDKLEFADPLNDQNQALTWLEKAAETGNKKAISELCDSAKNGNYDMICRILDFFTKKDVMMYKDEIIELLPRYRMMKESLKKEIIIPH